jgi:hypothetical protein
MHKPTDYKPALSHVILSPSPLPLPSILILHLPAHSATVHCPPARLLANALPHIYRAAEALG